MSPEALLAALRAGGVAAQQARTALAHTTNPDESARRAAQRAGVSQQLAASLLPTDHAIVCWLLEQEIAAHELAGHGASETLYTLVAAVARYADPDDVLLLWRAHQATPETRDGVDVEQATRAGVDRVRQRLNVLIREDGSRAAQATSALDWLEDGIVSGATEDLPGYFAWADERFGLHVSGPT